jgi:hypothetical protein
MKQGYQAARIAAFGLITATLAASPASFAETITFETSGAAGAAPSGFTQATTGKGSPADWKLQEVAGAPSGKLVVGQLSTEGANVRFPLLVHDATNAIDVDLSVKFKAVSGKSDQGAGLVWRYQNADNYYVVRANALENNVVLYVVKNGSRINMPVKGKGPSDYGAKAEVKPDWNTLAVAVKGDTFTVSLNGTQLYEVEDGLIKNAGKVGLWTKADSVMQFDDFKIENAK